MRKATFGLQLVLAGIALSVFGYVGYSKRLQLEARLSHWRNGDFVRVDKYEVQVPRDWLVKNGGAGLTLLIDTKSSHLTDSHLVGVVLIVPGAQTGGFDSWRSLKKEWLTQHGVNPIEEHSLGFEEELVTCLGGHELRQAQGLTDAISVECWSSGTLRLIFIGQQRGLDVLYSIIPKIHRKDQIR